MLPIPKYHPSLKQLHNCMHPYVCILLHMYLCSSMVHVTYVCNLICISLQNGEMPLKLAVDKEYGEIVYYFVKTIKQDIRSFDKVAQLKYTIQPEISIKLYFRKFQKLQEFSKNFFTKWCFKVFQAYSKEEKDNRNF